MSAQRTLQPPSSIERPFLRGAIHQVHALVGSRDSTKLSELIATDRLAVSQDGFYVASVEQVDELLERVAHNFERMSSPRFYSHENGERVETRILHVAADYVLVWGLPVGSRVRGVYELRVSRPRLKLVRPFALLHRVHRSSHGMFLFGIGTEDSGTNHVWTEHGVLPIEDIRTATAVSDGSFLFLEQIDGTSYRYRFGARGFVDWFPVLQAQGERPVALAYVQNQYVLATRTQIGSRLCVIGGANTLSFPLEETWSGDIEHLWVSPGERSLAWLVRPDRSNSSHRALYVNGALVHEGEFHMDDKDLVWAQTGSMLGARIRTEDANGQEKHTIVTPEVEQDFPSGTFVREFLVDSEGKVAATVTDDGESCYPKIYNRDFQAVPLAWNLTWTPENGIGFNSVLPESVVCRTTDTTELLRH
ncbi:hypothetical protein A3C09_02120 [Candidatus Uhrbacteria bacterium RIFCSPHIGHO2_02_FULL_47_44]|uniref:Uncharacterized protein n=1 Tax=Candidatus Uhrbacteria bacterium RIFCSPLOWO2_02_FULL_48_18 TaxID=1802408 RepID=A0A1F7VCU1_9BACT|nr:MAG: hypothetical protein A2839_00500 [Candidatus Uhrbacteria bacterium RIFCSPHIGHO2_01_FULL_47_10]OGL70476.1 MAG: hypothetical protein A3C09_02120 [Candidatus Uhrbacteria bacterium RIFCSPHIGHO2_02_FULL_47_44]OGL76832.1 MAG: hypothetical protein A3E97_01655 [Candidatus Uhrbacteria bacterium RIFCSPHIGHO2_12_FULL_47_12]OGL82301.1 MAG: hypothetical protein A3B20_00935 [Candidatus Uhrbacteria bacterium RIFCSPLOWO2_01_FULL_47_17]OGL87948.1 MAG: hypothetical protein A3I41_02465 [Candidatus Uhrbact